MKISPYFRNLRTAYQAELDDLTHDSDGADVLRQRLAQKRGEVNFLMQMIEISPEMVAVIFHRGFKFSTPAALEHLVSLNANQLPRWDALAPAMQVEPWAAILVNKVLEQPGGDVFLATTVGLEFLHQHSRMVPAAGRGASETESDDDEDADNDQHDGDDFNRFDADDAPDKADVRTREQAGADWMAEQGFERKD